MPPFVLHEMRLKRSRAYPDNDLCCYIELERYGEHISGEVKMIPTGPTPFGLETMLFNLPVISDIIVEVHYDAKRGEIQSIRRAGYVGPVALSEMYNCRVAEDVTTFKNTRDILHYNPPKVAGC